MDDTNMPFVMTYSSATLKLTTRVKSNFLDMREQSQTFKDHKIIAALRKNKSYLTQTAYVQNKWTKEIFLICQSGTVHTKNCI